MEEELSTDDSGTVVAAASAASDQEAATMNPESSGVPVQFIISGKETLISYQSTGVSFT